MIPFLLSSLFILPFALLGSESSDSSTWELLPDDIKKIILPRLEDLSDANIPLEQKISSVKYMTRLRITNRSRLGITLPEQYTLFSPNKVWPCERYTVSNRMTFSSQEFPKKMIVASVLSPDYLLKKLFRKALQERRPHDTVPLNQSEETLIRLCEVWEELYRLIKWGNLIEKYQSPNIHTTILNNCIKTVTLIAIENNFIQKIRLKNARQNYPQSLKAWLADEAEKNVGLFLAADLTKYGHNSVDTYEKHLGDYYRSCDAYCHNLSSMKSIKIDTQSIGIPIK